MNMITRRNFVPALLSIITFICFHVTLTAQVRPMDYSISGRITDSISHQALPNISIGLSTTQHRVVKNTLTKADGSFIFPAPDASKYLITITATGYQTKTLVVNLTDSTGKTIDLGNIPLSAAAQHLNEVSISGSKSLIKQEIDRISYDLQADPDSRANSVLEMMRKVPYLSLDADDNIQLKGSSNYKILINGKPSTMMESNPRQVLRSMPASTIQRIEVMTIPPSKYDAEGLNGIINIITNKKLAGGYSGTLNLNGKIPVGGPGFGGSFTVKEGKFGLSGFGGGSLYHVPKTQSLNQRSSSGAVVTDLSQTNLNKSDSKSGYIGTELSYEIDSLQLLSAQFNGNTDRSNGFGQQFTSLNSPTAILQQYRLANDNHEAGKSMDLSLNYQLGFKADKNRLLTLSYRYASSNNNQDNNIALSDQINYNTPDYRQHNVRSFYENTVQLDYIHAIKGLNIEAGIKGIFRSNKSDFRYLSLNEHTGDSESDPGKTNLFNNKQNILAAYNTYQFNLGNWGFKGGIRLERTDIEADFLSTETQAAQHLTNLIPSLSLSKKFKDRSSLNFGFTQRLQRPGIYQLNPFVDRSNPSLESSGNPNLHPITSNLFQLGYSMQQKAFINIGFDYIFFKTLINQVAVFDPATSITRSTYQNTGKASLAGPTFNINYSLTPKWNFSSNAKAAYVTIEGVSNGTLLRTEGLMYVISVSSGYRFEKGWRISANLSRNGQNISLQRKKNAYTGSSLSVNKELIKDKLSFSASVSNPFNKYRNNITAVSGPDFKQISDDRTYFRSYGLNLNYSFGKLKEVINKNKRGIKNDDIY